MNNDELIHHHVRKTQTLNVFSSVEFEKLVFYELFQRKNQGVLQM